MNEYLTPAEAADIMGVTDRTIRRWLEQRCVEGVDYTRTPGNRVRITRTCINTWTKDAPE